MFLGNERWERLQSRKVTRWRAVQVMPSVLVVAEVAVLRCELGWCENQLTLIKRLGEKKIKKNKLGRNVR